MTADTVGVLRPLHPAVTAFGPPDAVGLAYALYKRLIEAIAAQAELKEILTLLAAARPRAKELLAKYLLKEDGPGITEDGLSLTAPNKLPSGMPLEVAVARAQGVLDRFTEHFDFVEKGSREWIYLSKVERFVFGYAMGMLAIKRDKQGKIERSEERRYLETSESVLTSTSWGMFRAVGSLVAIGGVGASLMMFAAHLVPGLASELRFWLMVFGGGISVLWWGAFLLGRTGKAQNVIDLEFAAKLEWASKEAKKVEKDQFDLVWAQAVQAHEELTGTPFPKGSSVEFAFRHLMNGLTDDEKGEVKRVSTFGAFLKLAKIVRRAASFRRKVVRNVEMLRQKAHPQRPKK